MINTILKGIFSLTLIGVIFSSCVSHKDLVSFSNEENPFVAGTEDIVNALTLQIQAEDLLRIQVYSGDKDQKAAIPFNLEPPTQGNGNQQMVQLGGGGNYPLELFNGYLVDQNGFIDFPVLGRIQVEGLTLEQAKEKIITKLKTYIVTPVVSMRFLNLKITVLGEVNSPGTIRLSNKRVTILEAFGLAGDLTLYANRNNVLLIREEKGKRTIARLDLQNPDIFNSPFFYLRQNDVIYIEPINERIATVQDPTQRFISIGSGVVSGIISIITLLIVLNNN